MIALYIAAGVITFLFVWFVICHGLLNTEDTEELGCALARRQLTNTLNTEHDT